MTRSVEHSTLSATQAVTGRRSTRRFLPDTVPLSLVRKILTNAARAPSGTNSQPWKVYCVTGDARERVCKAVLDAAAARSNSPEEYAYMPSPLREPYLSRRRQVGLELYRLCRIERDDHVRREEAMLRNFEFFGAPVGLFFAMDRDLLYGSWLDCGMYMQNVMLLARESGLDTCPQQAWCRHGQIVHEELAIPKEQILLSGMALGFADRNAPENLLRSERVSLNDFAVFLTS